MTITNITERERELSVRVAELEAELAAVRNQQPIGAVGDMGRDRAIIWYDYHTKLPVGTLVYLDAGAQPAQQEPEGPLVDGWQITLSDGHAGYGVYAHMMEYPDEGAIFLLSAGAQPVPEGVVLVPDAIKQDAARYQWLTADLSTADGREKRNELLSRMSVMSYSAASRDIDAAMLVAAKEPK